MLLSHLSVKMLVVAACGGLTLDLDGVVGNPFASVNWVAGDPPRSTWGDAGSPLIGTVVGDPRLVVVVVVVVVVGFFNLDASAHGGTLEALSLLYEGLLDTPSILLLLGFCGSLETPWLLLWGLMDTPKLSMRVPKP